MQAVVDAATLYGASRFLRSVHKDPDYPFRDRFTATQDRLLFSEFIHLLLLYDDIVLDNSSLDIDRPSNTGEFWSPTSPLRTELQPLIERIVPGQGPALVERDICFLQENDHHVIKKFIADHLATHVDRESAESVAVPWAYNETHADFGSFKHYCDEAGIPHLTPLAMFLYRGLVYAAFAQPTHAIYLAAPGRLKALDVFLSDSDKYRFDYPRRAYSDLLSLLRLPDKGFDFSYLSHSGSGAHELSAVSRYIFNMPPDTAIDQVLKLRNSSNGMELRRAWTARLHTGAMVGMEQIEINQNIENSTAAGNINQSITIVPTYIVAKPRW
jgi:hypothetical protein